MQIVKKKYVKIPNLSDYKKRKLALLDLGSIYRFSKGKKGSFLPQNEK